VRNVMCPSDVMRTSCVMFAFGKLKGTHHITASRTWYPKTEHTEILGLGKASNITATAVAASLAPTAQTSQKIRGSIIMSESKLRDLSMAFSVQIINLVRDLKSKHETVISNQIGRSGTSIGANIYEANYAQGVKDFISKLEIALKESSETGYWLELLFRTNYVDEATYKDLYAQCTAIRVMLIASCRTAKQNQEKQQ